MVVTVFPELHSEALNIFTAYSHKDEALRDELEAHLSALKRTGRVIVFHDRRIVPGEDWHQVLDDAIFQCDIFLSLLSSDFIASDYCYGIELHTALELNRSQQTVVIPVALRPCDWMSLPELGGLQALPKDAVPITTWPNRDEAFVDVVRGVRRVVDEVAPKPIPLDVVLQWSPSAMVAARSNRLLHGILPRPRNALIVIAPDQAIIDESFIVSIMVTDEHGDINNEAPVIAEILGGVLGAERGVDPNRATTVEGTGELIVKYFVEQSPGIVRVQARGYEEQRIVIYAEPRPE